MDARTIEDFATEIAELIAIELPTVQNSLNVNNNLRKKLVDAVQNRAYLKLFFKDIRLKETVLKHRTDNPILLKQHYNTKFAKPAEISQDGDPMIDSELMSDSDKTGIYWYYTMPKDMYIPIMFFQTANLADFAVKNGQFYDACNGIPPYNASYLGMNNQQYITFINNLQNSRVYNLDNTLFNGFLQLWPTGQNDITRNVWYGLMEWPDMIVWYIPLKLSVIYANEELKDLYRRFITWQMAKQGIVENIRLSENDSGGLPIAIRTLSLYNKEKGYYLNKIFKNIPLS